MRVLAATSRTNGAAAGDYNHCAEGELVYMQDPCESDLRNPDGPCGCGRGFAGMNSHRATTTAVVVESELDESQVQMALRASLEAGGWLGPAHLEPEEAGQVIDDLVSDIRAVAEHFPVGAVVRRRLSQYAAEPFER